MCRSIAATAARSYFTKMPHYAAFLALLQIGQVEVIQSASWGFCLMPNHFHLVLQPATADALSPFMQWWMTEPCAPLSSALPESWPCLARALQRVFPFNKMTTCSPCCAYVVRNPVRAQLVASVMQWPWSSLQHPTLADPSPVPLPDNWLHWIDQPLFEARTHYASHLSQIARLPLAHLTGSREVLQGWLVWTRRFVHVARLRQNSG